MAIQKINSIQSLLGAMERLMTVVVIDSYRAFFPHLRLIFDDFTTALEHLSAGGREYLMTFFQAFRQEYPLVCGAILKIKDGVDRMVELILHTIIWFGEMKLGMTPVQ